MADVKTEEEPSIEEILESIRQIISEDDEGSTGGGDGLPTAAEAAAAQGGKLEIEEQQIVETVLELTDKVAPPPAPAPVARAQEPEQEEPEELAMTDTSPENDFPDDIEKLLSDPAENASADSLAKLLAMNIAVERELPGRVGNVTLEDIARELMKPVIKSWLDQNLPRIVESMVQKEIVRLSKRVMDK